MQLSIRGLCVAMSLAMFVGVSGSSFAQENPAPNAPPAANPPAENPAAVNPPARDGQPNAAPEQGRGQRRGGRGRGARGPAPQVMIERDSQPFTPSNFESINPDLPTLFIAGDSTADRGPDAWHRGWGAIAIDYFDTSKLNVVNLARGGRSFRSFIRDGLWDQLVAQIKPGDYVVIQFGHNDGGAVTNPNGRGDLVGTGPETQDVTLPDGTVETVLTYGAYVRKYIGDVVAKGGHPIVLSTTVYNRWNDDGKMRISATDLQAQMNVWAREAAEAAKVQWADHGAAIAAKYNTLGKAVVDTYYPADGLHTGTNGAVVLAEQFVAALKGLDNHPLVGYLNDTGKQIPAFAPPPAAPAPANN